MHGIRLGPRRRFQALVPVLGDFIANASGGSLSSPEE
ncbi:hypothetical protein RHCRD62_90228 [Rhodococcus sp. RD6.2]|nr:hypothetical protein RHCRD62_90228 [Rhodococcus sp. RD6.2]